VGLVGCARSEGVPSGPPDQRSATSAGGSAAATTGRPELSAAPGTALAPSGAPPAPSHIPPGPTTLGLERCEPASHLAGASLGEDRLPKIADAIAETLCYGYFRQDVTPAKLSASLRSCAAAVGTAFEAEMSMVKTGGTCTVKLGAATWHGRLFVRTQETYATNVPVAGGETTFGVGVMTNLLELEGEVVHVLARGQPCDALDDPKSEVIGDLSPGLRKDWGAMPAELRKFLCADGG
jgi:hypothetical protein